MAHMKEFEHLKIKLEDIKKATNNFSHDNFIGEGGFGQVYTGKIAHSKGQTIVVAFKRLNRVFGQGDPEFWKEIMTLSLYRHENIVSLLGYCDDSHENILVYEYVSRQSLDQYLHNNDLTWVQRLKICIGAARGLAFLHTPVETQLRLLHRDIKSSNILLDENWNAKISDFGLSKFVPASKRFTYLITNAVGTLGYCDPLYVESGLLTKESDVYSFGVVLFEVLCGRLCIGNKNNPCVPLIGLVREYYKENKICELIDGNIVDEINPECLKVFVEIAYKCLARECKDRPSMTQIVEALESALKLECSESKPHPVGILYVKVLRATDVKKGIHPSNPYLILELDGNVASPYKKKSSVKHNKVNPEWNEDFTLYVHDYESQDLGIYLYNVVLVEKHEYLGRSEKILRYITTPEIPQIFNLDINSVSYDCIGKLIVEMVYKPFTWNQIPPKFEDVIISPIEKAPVWTPKGGGLLLVIIHNGNFYHESNNIQSSVSLLFRGESRNTMIVMDTNHPIWKQGFIFMLKEPPTNEKLHLEVVNNNLRMGLIPPKRSLGWKDISLADVVNKKRTISLYVLQETSSNYLSVELQWRPSNKRTTRQKRQLKLAREFLLPSFRK